MKIIIKEKTALEYFYNALCNGGITMLSDVGIDFDYAKEDYKAAKQSLLSKNPNLELCREDIWMEILEIGKLLKFIDCECNGVYSKDLYKKDIIEKVKLVPHDVIIDYVEENDDEITAFNYIQAILYDGELIFG